MQSMSVLSSHIGVLANHWLVKKNSSAAATSRIRSTWCKLVIVHKAKGMSETTEIKLITETKRKLGQWVLSTLDPLLLVAHLTIVYIVFLKADELVLAIITSSFKEVITESYFVEQLLLAVKIFSAIGVAIGYGFHIIYQLVKEAKHFVSTMKKELKTPEAEVK